MFKLLGVYFVLNQFLFIFEKVFKMEKLLEWNEELSTGYERFDEEHKEIFDIINDLYFAIKKMYVKYKIVEIVDKMVEYTETHFKDEEQEFVKNNYIDIDAHMFAHKKFVQKSKEFQRDVRANPNLVAIQTLNFLRTWWRQHILSMDRKYKGLLG